MFGLKREIEEKTSDYDARRAAAQKERIAEVEAERAREAEVKAAAAAASRKRLIGFKLQYRRKLRSWTFAAEVKANFLLLSWTDEKGQHSHAINLSAVEDISLDVSEANAPQPKGSAVVYNKHTWEFAAPGANVDVGRWYGPGISSFWKWSIWGDSYPSPARDATIRVTGVPFQVKVPYDRARAAYAAILAAIAAA